MVSVAFAVGVVVVDVDIEANQEAGFLIDVEITRARVEEVAGLGAAVFGF